MDSLHNEAITLDPDFILWPEAALPTYLRINYSKRRSILQKVKKSNVHQGCGQAICQNFTMDHH